MKFTLIVPTINRVVETRRLFESLEAQEWRDFEVVVVDQNGDDRLSELAAHYGNSFPVTHIREAIRGQSHARNVGFANMRGDIVAFPDDDCVYPSGVLVKVARFFGAHPEFDGLIARVFDLDEDRNAFEPCGDDRSQVVDYARGYKNCVSCAMFFRAAVARSISFNEILGPGAGTRWACGEETDFLFRCLDAGFRFYYDAAVIVRHPNPLKHNTFRNRIRRAFNYGLGKGYFLATHRLPRPLLRAEKSTPYLDAVSSVIRGDIWRGSCFLANGLGTLIGYRAGRRASDRESLGGLPVQEKAG